MISETANAVIRDRFHITLTDHRLTTAAFLRIFEGFIEKLKSFQKEYDNFQINLANRLAIGFTNNEIYYRELSIISSYSPSVYNNFPWCNPTDEQKAKIEQTAQAILDARALYPDCSLADLYDELTMPVELRKAHQANDKAVMQAYGFNYKTMTESECVAELMKMYQNLTK